MKDLIKKQVATIQLLWGLSFGFYIFTYGYWLFQSYKNITHSNADAMTFLFILMIIRQAGLILFEVPTGVITDNLGRSLMIKVAFAFKLIFQLGLFIIIFIASKYSIIVVGVILSISFSIASSSFNGSLSRYVYDHYGEATDEYKATVAKGHQRFFIGELLAGLISVILLYYNMQFAPYLFGVVCCCIGLIYAIRILKDAPQIKKSIKWVEKLKIAKIVFSKLPANATLILLFGVFMFLLNLIELQWMVHLFGKEYSQISISVPILLGLILCFCIPRLVASSIARIVIARLQDSIGSARNCVIATTVLSSICIFSLGSINYLSGEVNIYFFTLTIIVVVFTHGFSAPLIEILQNYYFPKKLFESRATMLSLGSMFRSILVVLFACFLKSDLPEKIPSSWIIPSIVLFIISIITNFILINQDKKIIFLT